MNPSHGLSWEKSGEQEGVFATLFILTGKLNNFCQFYNSTGTLGVALKEYSVNFVLKSPFILIVGASTGAYLVLGYCGTSGYYAGIATEITGSNKLFTFYANNRGNAPSFSEK